MSTTKIFTLSLHDALPICDVFYELPEALNRSQYLVPRLTRQQRQEAVEGPVGLYGGKITARLVDRVLNDVSEDSDQDRKSTRLNSSHRTISYAVFCLKKKK